MKCPKALKKTKWRTLIGVILFLSLLLSIFYIIYKIIVSPAEAAGPADYEHLKSDYSLMLVQCLLGLIVMALPSVIERKWSIAIPNYMYILYFVFLFCAIYLGEVQNFYYRISNWDSILHAFSGGMLGALGFSLVSILNDARHVKMQLSPAFIAFFAFCFALAAGAVWEIYEYTLDGIMGLNMQKYATESSVSLIGREALTDTMTDILMDAGSALVITLIGFFSLKKKEKSLSK